ncbi:hypothetical protein GOB57_21510 [Sinorhizobium meliloti]|nr:hypothetical protein [Sinorhizobium meliloti]
MDGEVKERLENQAFMATVVRTGGPGLGVAEWMDFVATSVGGYIGDVYFGADSEPWRVVLALSEEPFSATEKGADIPSSVAGALSVRLSEIKDTVAAVSLGEIANVLRARYLAGGALECSVAGEGVSLDFARGRHMVASGRHLMALFVHGMTVLGTYYDPKATVVSVSPDGSCELVNGSKVPFATIGEPEASREELVAIAVPQRHQPSLSPLAARIARSSAGSMRGPEPTGMILSRGEDGRVMLALNGELPEGKIAVRFLPAAVQLIVDGELAAQSGFGEVAEILGWLDDSSVEVCVIAGGVARWSKAAVEIRTSA